MALRAPLALQAILEEDCDFLSGCGRRVKVLLDGGTREVSRIFIRLRFRTFEAVVKDGPELNLQSTEPCGDGFNVEVWDDVMRYVGGDTVRGGRDVLVRLVEFLHVWDVKPAELLSHAVKHFCSLEERLTTVDESVRWVLGALCAIRRHSPYLAEEVGCHYIATLQKQFPSLLQCDLGGVPCDVMGTLLDHNQLCVESEAVVLDVVRKWACENGGYHGLLEKVRPCVPVRMLDELLEFGDRDLKRFALVTLGERRYSLNSRISDNTLHPDLFRASDNRPYPCKSGDHNDRPTFMGRNPAAISRGILVLFGNNCLSIKRPGSDPAKIVSLEFSPNMLQISGDVVFGAGESKLFSCTFDGRLQMAHLGLDVTCMSVSDKYICYGVKLENGKGSVRMRYADNKTGDLGLKPTEVELNKITNPLCHMVIAGNRVVFAATKKVFSRECVSAPVFVKRCMEEIGCMAACGGGVAIGLKNASIHILDTQTLNSIREVDSCVVPMNLFCHSGFAFVVGPAKVKEDSLRHYAPQWMMCYDFVGNEEPIRMYPTECPVMAMDAHGGVLSLVTLSSHITFKPTFVSRRPEGPPQKKPRHGTNFARNRIGLFIGVCVCVCVGWPLGLSLSLESWRCVALSLLFVCGSC